MNLSLQHLRNKAPFLEDRERLRLLAGADETGGDAELVEDHESDAAFSGAVELGDDEAVERAGLVEFLGLAQGVGAGAGIDDKQGEVRRGLVLLGDGAADFSQLLHEVVAGVDAPGGVADQEIGLGLDGALVRLEADGGGVGIRFPGDDLQPEPVAPALELLDGGGAESVGGGEDHGVVALFQPHPELGGRGGFPGSVHADY